MTKALAAADGASDGGTHSSGTVSALQSAGMCIQEYMGGEWDGNREGWNAQLNAINQAIQHATQEATP